MLDRVFANIKKKDTHSLMFYIIYIKPCMYVDAILMHV